LNLKKCYFCELINLIKFKYCHRNEFFPFFTFRKKYDVEEEEREIDRMEIKVYLRYNNLSNKIELLFNDLSHILKIANFKAQSKIKKKFLKKFSHEFRNPLLNIVQMIENLKEEKIENFGKKSQLYYSTNNPINPNNNTNSTHNILFHGIELPKEKNQYEESRLNTEQQSSDCEKTLIVSKIDFEAVAETARHILEKENFYNNSKNKIYSVSSDNSALTNKDKHDCSLSRKKPSEKINSKILLENIEERHVFSSPTNYQDLSINFQSQKSVIKDLQRHKDSSNISAAKEKNTYKGSINNHSRTSFNTIKQNNLILNKKNMPNKTDFIKFKFSEISKKREISLQLKITNFNHIKYTCYYLNYLINDFDFITNHDINNKDSKNFKNYMKINHINTITIHEKKKYEKNIEVYYQMPTEINIHKLLKKLINIFRSKII